MPSPRCSLGAERGSDHIDCIEQQLGFEGLANVCGLPKTVFLSLKSQQGCRDVSIFECSEHCLCLVERHNWIILTVEEYDRGGKSLHKVDWRPLVIQDATWPVRLDQPVHVMQFKLVCISGKRSQITDAVITAASRKHCVEGKPAQGCVAARAPAGD